MFKVFFVSVSTQKGSESSCEKQAKKAKEDGNEPKVIISRTFFNIVQSTYKICICIFLPGVAEEKEEPVEEVGRQQEMSVSGTNM